jgi:hypothetical protein
VPDDEQVPLVPDDIDNTIYAAFWSFFTFHAISFNTYLLEIVLQKPFWCI